MQCKDIPTEPVLRFIASFNGQWCNWYFGEKDVSHAMPAETPKKLVLAKMRNLINKGYVSGCDCGCRGDFTLRRKGRLAIGLERDKMGLEEN